MCIKVEQTLQDELTFFTQLQTLESDLLNLELSLKSEYISELKKVYFKIYSLSLQYEL